MKTNPATIVKIADSESKDSCRVPKPGRDHSEKWKVLPLIKTAAPITMPINAARDPAEARIFGTDRWCTAIDAVIPAPQMAKLTISNIPISIISGSPFFAGSPNRIYQ